MIYSNLTKSLSRCLYIKDDELSTLYLHAKKYTSRNKYLLITKAL